MGDRYTPGDFTVVGGKAEMEVVRVAAYGFNRNFGIIRIPGEGLGLDSCAVAKRVGWCAMSRGGRPWRGLLVI